MAFKMPERFQKIFDDLKNTPVPQQGEAFFYDLSTESYQTYRVSTGADVRKLLRNIPKEFGYAVIANDEYVEYPEFYLVGPTFSLRFNLETQKIMFFQEVLPVDIERLKAQFQALAELLNSDAS